MKKVILKNENEEVLFGGYFLNQDDIDEWAVGRVLEGYELQVEDIGDELLWEKLREERNKLLSSCDWTQLADAPLTNEEKQLWIDYRQSLRDLPENVEDINNVVWPQQPS